MSLNVVRYSRHGLTIARSAARLLESLLSAGYRVTRMAFSSRDKANGSRMHQDRMTGSPSFNRAFDECGQRYPPDLMAPALRVLISAATLTDDVGQPPRYMRWTLDKKDGREVLRSEARLVAMTANAAGSGMHSNVYHGRYGDGVTLSLDLVYPLHASRAQAFENLKPPRVGSLRLPSIVRWINTPERLSAMTFESVEYRSGHHSSQTGRLQRFQEWSSPEFHDREVPHGR